jgi:competence protein ComEC
MRSFLRKISTLILSLAIALCFIPCLTADTAVGVGSSNNATEKETTAQTSRTNSEVEREVVKDQPAEIDTALKETETAVLEKEDLAVSESSGSDLPAEEEGSFWIEFIDVGQGDSILIQCDGHYMLIDGGPSSASSVVYTILKNSEIDYLDYMIATHPDADHIGGLSGALNYAKVGVCYSPVTTHDTKTFESLVKYLNKQNVSVTVPSAGTSFQLGRADVEILGPIERSSDTNNNSIVTRVVFGNTAFLFMGDAEIEEENSLIEAGVNLSCDVLKAGHHGSSGSTGSEFLRKAAPDYAVFSVGSENSYGHPTDETLARLEACGVSIYRTDMQGDVVCQSDGNVITFVTEKKASEEALWIAGPSSNSTVTRDGVVVAAPEKTEIPEGTTFVLNTSSKKFHLTTCSSVGDISEKNRAFSTDSAEELIAAGYKPCGRCNPSDSHIHNDDSIVDQSTSDVKQEQQENGVTGSYVLNTKTLKFHRPDCSSVTEMNANNRKDVTMSREEIINQGYSPCKRCNP